MPGLFDRLFGKQGIVNVRMVITEEKILSNIEKVQKMINPKSKKQIVQLEDDTYFKDLVESIKTYLEEYPKKKNFPSSVYKAAYDLVEFATNQFEENTKKIEELIIQREKNIGLAFELKTALSKMIKKEPGFENELNVALAKFPSDVGEALKIIAGDAQKEEKIAARKLIDARINNLESNFHIEIDMERIEDKSKALSYIGIEIADALKYIPAPVEETPSVTMSAEQQGYQAPVTPVQNSQPQIQKQQPVHISPRQTIMQGGSNFAAASVRPQQRQQVQQPQQQPTVQQRPVQQNYVQPVGNQNRATFSQQRQDDKILNEMYMKETRFDVKPSLWERIKNSKVVRTVRYVMKIRVVLELPALPEGRGESNF